MTTSLSNKAMLTCHPETPSQAVQEIQAGAVWTQDSALIFTYALKADLTRLRIPPPTPSRKADRLWQHTCFEAFILVKGKREYYEFNFAPSGDWAVYRFQRYRDGTPVEDDMLAPRISVSNTADRFDLHAIVRLDRLPTIPPDPCLLLALSAVIEDQSGELSYWALRHPPGRPDFHHPDSFALKLNSPMQTPNKPAMEKR